jgi:hypothetical protein
MKGKVLYARWLVAPSPALMIEELDDGSFYGCRSVGADANSGRGLYSHPDRVHPWNEPFTGVKARHALGIGFEKSGRRTELKWRAVRKNTVRAAGKKWFVRP